MLDQLIRERPVGTEINHELVEMMEQKLLEIGFEVKSIPFNCQVWHKGSSIVRVGKEQFVVEPSPFSEGFEGKRRVNFVGNLKELRKIACKDRILFLFDELTQTPLSPKDYPFYYPGEHQEFIELLEEKQPAAIIAVTGTTLLNGKNPFPLFEDGNFLIPSVNINQDTFQQIKSLMKAGDMVIELTINSYKESAQSRQLIATKTAKNSKGKIILAAHMDSKYDTKGVLDNAMGLAVLLEVAKRVDSTNYDIELVPFNTEEYYEASGEQAYLETLKEKPILMINIDSPCHTGSKTAISFYQLNEEMKTVAEKIIKRAERVVTGEQWFAGDHIPFVQRGIPSMAITSSDFYSGALVDTHTPRDVLNTVDTTLIKSSADYLVDFMKELSSS